MDETRWPRSNVTGIYTGGCAACIMIYSHLNVIPRAGVRLLAPSYNYVSRGTVQVFLLGAR